MRYKKSLDALVDFVVRIQPVSETRTELAGGFFRAFDYKKWEVWAR
mgnify:CR=1 FL=1